MDDESTWLTVKKPRKVKTGVLKAADDETEKSKDPKMIIQMSMKTEKLYSSGTNKENQVPVVKKRTQIPIKVKPAKKNLETTAGITKHKNLHDALKLLNANELKSLLDATRIQYNNQVILLKTALNYLNDNLKVTKVDDMIFFDKPLDHTKRILPNDIRCILEQLVGSTNKENLQYFFNNLLNSLCEDINKNRNFIGHIILLQQIVFIYPEVVLSNLASTVILRNSYQNQSSICLSLIWCLGSAALSDTTIGLKVWSEIISSVIHVKSYTKFAFEYLYKIMQASDKTPKLNLSIDEFQAVVDLVLTNYDPKAKPKELQALKLKSIELLCEKFVKSADPLNLESIFLMLLMYSKKHPETFIKGIAEAINADAKGCLNIWKQNFDRNFRQSLIFFNYLDNNLNDCEQVISNPLLKQFIKGIDFRKYPQFKFALDLPAKMTESKKQKKPKKNADTTSGSSCVACKWFFGSFLMLAAIAGLMAYDTHALHGGKFEESTVGRVLKQTGALPHVENAWYVSMKYCARGFKWAEEHAPTAYGKTKTVLEPYCDFAKDLGLTVVNGARKGWEATKVFATEKTPVAVEFIDKYVPGLGQKIQDVTATTCKGLCSITCNGWRSSVEFFKTKVFVGQLSPENLAKAFNTTTHRALGYYSWFHEKVDFYAKIK